MQTGGGRNGAKRCGVDQLWVRLGMGASLLGCTDHHYARMFFEFTSAFGDVRTCAVNAPAGAPEFPSPRRGS
jgi:hypothetical protein